jgi:tetratricopeptide (TPR) repeat protein
LLPLHYYNFYVLSDKPNEMKRFLACIISLVFNSAIFAHDAADSLHRLIGRDTHDTSRIAHLLKLSEHYSDIASYDSSIACAERATGLACRNLGVSEPVDESMIRQLNANSTNQRSIRLLAAAISDKALGVFYRGDYNRALDMWKKALLLDEKTNDRKGIAKRAGNIGYCYQNMGNYPQALNQYLEALRMDEELKDPEGMMHDLASLGSNYRDLGEYDKSLSYYFRALKMAREQGNKSGISRTLGGIGLVYSCQAKHHEALQYYSEALKITEETGDKRRTGVMYNNIGIVYDDLHEFPKALENYMHSLEIAREIGDPEGIARAHSNISTTELNLKDYRKAFDHIYRGVTIADSLGLLEFLRQDYYILSTLYERSSIPLPDTLGGKILSMENMRLRSKYYIIKCYNTKDSIFSVQNKRAILQKEVNYEFEKKETEARAQREKEKLLEAEASKRQRLYFILMAAIAAGIGIIAFLVFRSLRITRSQKAIIEQQKEQVELAKVLIEEKNKEVMDSIHYARRIQRALIPSERYIQQTLQRLRKKDS